MQQKDNTIGVTETLEVIELATTALQSIQDILRSDTKPSVLSLGMKLYELSVPVKTAIAGADKIDDELLNLTHDEFVNRLGTKVLEFAYAIYQDAIANVKP